MRFLMTLTTLASLGAAGIILWELLRPLADLSAQ